MSDSNHSTDIGTIAYLHGVESGKDYERAKIVAWLRGETGCAWSRDVIEACDAIETGEHLK